MYKKIIFWCSIDFNVSFCLFPDKFINMDKLNGCINECASIQTNGLMYLYFIGHICLYCFIILSHSLTCSQLLINGLLVIMWLSLIMWIEHKLSVLCLNHMCCNFTCEITPMSTGGQQWAGHVVSCLLLCSCQVACWWLGGMLYNMYEKSKTFN